MTQTMTLPQINPDTYAAAHNTAVFTDRSTLGTIKITGETRLDLINRMSTQKVDTLTSGEGAATILTTDIGRIIDRLILTVSSDTVYALTSDHNADAIIRYLMRFVFFNDDFHMTDISADTAVFAIYGPQAATRLQAAGFPETDIPLHHWRQADINGAVAYLHRTDPIAGNGYLITCQTSAKTTVYQALLAADITPADSDAYEALRIEAGLPKFGHEITGDYIPLEANLWDDVSFNKGCYIGQEIIARMESRGRMAKKLVPLRPAAAVPPGTDLTADGKAAGVVTSAALTPTGIVALGYVKTAVLNDPPNTLTADETAVSLT